MTAPDGSSPSGSLGVGAFAAWQSTTEEQAKAAMKGGVIGAWENAQGVAHTNYNDVINDHSQSITELREIYQQFILQGLALVFESNNTWQPSEDLVSFDIILIAAGAGGGSGRWDVLADGRTGGGGGGGGGEIHKAGIPAALLPTDGGGEYLPVNIVIGAGGSGGGSSGTPGGGGGNTVFGSGNTSIEITVGGGQGGASSNLGQVGSTGGLGGVGMVRGGAGGRGAAGNGVNIALAGGASTSDYDLYGGGGGGGGGASTLHDGANGGPGGISPGGTPSQPGQSPSAIIATGGGGGGGAQGTTLQAGAGAFPAGGGGGGGGGINQSTPGGNGGNGILYIVERMS